MSLYTASLNSGSNGNCYLISDGVDAVLIDAGVSCREVEQRMKRLNLPMSSIKAIFISHEHTDHISGLNFLSKKHQLPVYITPSTLRNSSLDLDDLLVRPFVANVPVHIGKMAVTAMRKKHDAIEPHSFVVEGNGVTIGVFTDIGEVCENVSSYFNTCDAAYLEANYDDELLMNGRYATYLKKRISGPVGHLSNVQALELFLNHKSERLSHLFLSHLSKENNLPELALGVFERYSKYVNIAAMPRYSESELYLIKRREQPIAFEPKKQVNIVKKNQLSLF